MKRGPVRTPRPNTIGREHRLADLLDALLGPRLPARPLCTGLAPMFDHELPGEPADQRDARHDRAVAICRRCAALTACTALLDDLPAGTTGVWAAELLDGRKRPEHGRSA